MPERLFLFVQLEFPWELGPADGRYLLRGGAEREPEHVVVLNTVGAAPRTGLLGARRARRRPLEPEPEPTRVPVTRATVIDPVPVSAEIQAEAWLKELDGEREAWAAAAVLNRMLAAHRIAIADPYVHELSPAEALVLRAGWGEGEQVADGRWAQARELSWAERRDRRRSAALRPQERLAAFLSGREAPLLCEELVLRARKDLDQGRPRHAAVELEGAYRTALAELGSETEPGEARADLAERLVELRDLHEGVERAAAAAIPSRAAWAAWAAIPGDRAALEDSRASGAESIRHALERLEAALRARTAAGLPGEASAELGAEGS